MEISFRFSNFQVLQQNFLHRKVFFIEKNYFKNFCILIYPMLCFCRHSKAQFQQAGICCQPWQCQHKCKWQWAWIQSGTYYVSQNAKTYSGLSASFLLSQFQKIKIGPVVLEKLKFFKLTLARPSTYMHVFLFCFLIIFPFLRVSSPFDSLHKGLT